MVIERALKKLKEAQLASGVAPPAAQPEVRTPEAPPRELAPVLPRPVFPLLECDRACAEAHRIALPNSMLAADERVAAAYRMVRTRLLQRMRTHNWSSVAITSPDTGEGKSVTSLNLALNIARHDTHNVFLLDLDLRSPSLCTYLGVRPPTQLIDYFAGNAMPADLFFCIGPQNLAIAANVSATSLASELLSHAKLDELITYIKRIAPNPILLIDLAPITVTDEALAVAPRVDAMLLVVAERKTRRDSLARAKQLLADFPSAGIVLNRSTAANGASGYYYYVGDT
ncbi:MAG TPA: CpsD/CapB family tyrosine-protein kinase [Steroidobacteraceae bacterium]|nr:CpsD/CapB family tyrosine-protein kinase [Steroidobacteraceae bacterium]